MIPHRCFRHGLNIAFVLFLIMYVLAVPLVCAQDSEKQPELPLQGGYATTPNESVDLIAAFDGSLNYSDLSGQDGLVGGNLNALVAPAYKISDNAFFIFLYDGKYHRKREVYSDDIGSKERSEYARHAFTPMLRFTLGRRNRIALTPSLISTFTFNKDTEDGKWKDGLYNYSDLGIGLDFEMRGIGVGILKAGMQYYSRQYTNFQSNKYYLPISEPGLVFERDDKDYNGIILTAGYGSPKSSKGLSWEVKYSLLNKMLTDNAVVDKNGFLKSSDQVDIMHNIYADIGFMMMPDLTLGLSFDMTMKDSNQSYVDGNSASDITMTIIADFYDYTQYRLQPYLTYKLPMLPPLSLTAAYAFQQREYSDRSAKTVFGTYKGSKQWETEQSLNVDATYALTKKVSLLARLEHISANSNNQDESVYQYDYIINNIAVGASYRY